MAHIERHDELSAMQSEIDELIWSLPFVEYLFPEALETMAYLGRQGRVIILTDGEERFQRIKIQQAGLQGAVYDSVVCKDKTLIFDQVISDYPASRYVLIDDKPRVIVTARKLFGHPLTTVLVNQGKYASTVRLTGLPEADVIVDTVGQLRQHFPPIV
jgi:FMN phosphatase YigB (HAD superfamily)